MRILFFILIFISNSYANLIMAGSVSRTKNWTQYSSDQSLNVKFLLQNLIKSDSGKSLVIEANKKARSFNAKLSELISVGDTSVTDTTLYRKFSSGSASNVQYETKSKVYINRNLSQYDALLDLAHELTHFVHREAFNPYKAKFTLEKFIESTIEAKGGEAHAFITECSIINELFPKELMKRHNCRKIITKNSLSMKHAVKQFYSVGEYYENFSVELSKFVDSSSHKHNNNSIQFISSAYGVPYPVAAFYEYNAVMKKVCSNDLARFKMLERDAGRSPASLSKLKTSLDKRCEGYF